MKRGNWRLGAAERVAPLAKTSQIYASSAGSNSLNRLPRSEFSARHMPALARAHEKARQRREKAEEAGKKLEGGAGAPPLWPRRPEAMPLGLVGGGCRGKGRPRRVPGKGAGRKGGERETQGPSGVRKGTDL